MKIAIKLNNPDFVNVFEDILQVFLDNLERNGIFYRINKEHLLFIINELSFPYYLLRHTKNLNNYKLDINHSGNKSYTKIFIEQLYINSEVDKLLNNGIIDKHTIIVLDTNLKDKIYSINT